MKPKAKTLIEKMGFVDKDMLNSDHDTIVEWIDENYESLILQIIPRQDLVLQISLDFDKRLEQAKCHLTQNKYIDYHTRPMLQKYKTFKEDIINKNLEELITDINKSKLKHKDQIGEWNHRNGIWEKPIIKKSFVKNFKTGFLESNGNTQIIGFIDYSRVSYCSVKYLESNLTCYEMNWYFEMENNNLKIPYLKKNKHEYNFYFEAKTSIPSIGELLRQIQFYKNYIPCDKRHEICIVSYPNPRAQKIVEAQGFVWIDYPGEKPQGKSKGQKTLF